MSFSAFPSSCADEAADYLLLGICTVIRFNVRKARRVSGIPLNKPFAVWFRVDERAGGTYKPRPTATRCRLAERRKTHGIMSKTKRRTTGSYHITPPDDCR